MLTLYFNCDILYIDKGEDIMKHRYFYDYCVYENGDVYNSKGKLMTHAIKNDRKEIRLTIAPSKRKTYISARLIYCLFNDIDIESFDKDNCVSFKDGNKLNISLDNLHCVYRGDLIQGQKHKAINKLTDKQVQEIRERYKQTEDNKPINQYDNNKPYNSYRSLAKEYGVTYALIRHIIKGNTRNEDNYKLKGRIED